MNYIGRLSGKHRVIAVLSILVLGLLTASITYAAGAGSVRVTNVVLNGTAHPSDFTLQIKSGNTTSSGSGDVVTFSGLSSGAHTITKVGGPSGYSIKWSGDCNAQGVVTIISNVTKRCTASYLLGSVGSIKVNVVVSGGTATPSDVTVHIKKNGEADTGSPSGSGGAITFSDLIPGGYRVIASPLTGYTASWSGACNSQGNVTVAGDATATCTLTNTYSSNSGGRTDRDRTTRAPRTSR